MNNTLATLAVFLVAAMFLSQAEAQFVCCFGYGTRPVPLRLLKSYVYTDDSCSLPAVIFITHKNRQMCENPDEEWVQDRISHLPHN